MLLSAVLGCAAAAQPAGPSTSRPNILFVVLDDLGWADVGFRSSDIKTPTTDSLAAQGVVLDQYYCQDTCSPSRATFLSGRFPIHHTVVTWLNTGSPKGLPIDEVTIADLLVAEGYATHAVGKWHLGFALERMTPTYRGFTSFYGFYGGSQGYYSHRKYHIFDFTRHTERWCNASCRQLAVEVTGKYTTHLLSAETVRIIEQHDASKPFFIYLAHQAPHSPAKVPASYERQYADPKSPGYIADPVRRTFAGMVSCVDEGLTNITNALAARGMQDQTIIVYTSDNGGPNIGQDSIGSRNWPLRGGKHAVWEGGTRIIGFVWGPGVGIRGGATYPGMMHGADWLPTLCDFAGVSITGRTKPLDGVSQRKNLLDHTLPSPRSSFIYGHATSQCRRNGTRAMCGFGIRRGPWKYIRGHGGNPDKWCNKTQKGTLCAVPYGTKPKAGCPGEGCLFNVIADPSEVHEVGAEHPSIAAEMRAIVDPLLASDYVQAAAEMDCLPQHHFLSAEQQAITGAIAAHGPWCTLAGSSNRTRPRPAHERGARQPYKASVPRPRLLTVTPPTPQLPSLPRGSLWQGQPAPRPAPQSPGRGDQPHTATRGSGPRSGARRLDLRGSRSG
eukprot:TRINITY_DN2434_c0_g2_i1.p1 TRINITY_DN2434_c0_g2~~TRINITY_DN2434_c0_g2_i1.p1  ORF type:complete len:613 (+),score=121.34 TRINITY_DN2434_c0_g2_i1:123-1961(+)